ncbi:methyltransferase family protein [Hephaestia caeni]|uniref:Methyltransferase family protein n=1 Tax=Hephaestia caeni TaxID=645617 RepID=A0A397PH15_9SPHN|nr:class I SAM-dependent methyltransferase [Hephaestia caeni]RIA47169.1 methyltransferase family protein [Hephaestia caeni]
MTLPPSAPDWDARYDRADYLFGTEPNAFLKRETPQLDKCGEVLCVADGEGRNSVWLAKQGLRVHAVDASAVALDKAGALATREGVADAIRFEQVDLTRWRWPHERYHSVVAIFIQFAGPAARADMFSGMKEALVPGGLLLLQGYRPEQIDYATGGPGAIENLYDESMLRSAFDDFEICKLVSYDAQISEGDGHNGMSALIDLIARKPVL